MTNSWPDPARPGVPLNPEQDGWHYLKGSASLSNPRPVFWEVFLGAGRWADQRLDDPVILSEMEYLGPCLTPAEVQNLRDDLESVERERAHQHGRADRNAAEYAREQAKREALQKRVTELEARVAKARRAALEEAAEVARKVPIPDECCHNEAHGRLSSALEAAMRIRALMEKKDE